MTTTDSHEIAKLNASFVPSKDGAFPTSRSLPGQYAQANRQEWAERGTINGQPATVYYVFENSEAADDGSGMPFDVEHIDRIEIGV